jgi:hypothetical protein
MAPMSFRFRKRLKLFPGVWINLSKRGGSVSVGGKGLTAKISKRGLRETVGLPGTGISYTTKTYRPGQHRGARKRASLRSAPPAQFLGFIITVVIVLWLLGHLH